MVSRKYTSDYTLETYMDGRGRLRERASYTGSYYEFCNDSASIRRSTWILAIGFTVLALCVFVPLIFGGEYAKQMYVFLPLAFGLIPLYLLAAAFRRILMVKGPVIREHKDKIVARLNTAAAFMLIVSVLNLAAAVVYFIAVKPDWAMGAFAVLGLCQSVQLFSFKKAFAMKEAPKNSEH
ncbi:MAG: hypothetical protein E7467_01525 [Ruminococcaceae bacterium]|nr:hypothetical protein [Oscillospiraceae bacterium]